jgi:ethanolaminephosphotransferase
MDLLDLARDITDKDIENLKNYKYTAGEYTKLDNLMNSFWLWAVELLPKTLAPNMITIYAFISGVLPAILIVFYDPTFQAPYPAILHVLAALGIFLYQTLDALDGKQARRINAKSPLGQLFDHGCDSLSTAAFMIHSLSCLRTPSLSVNLLVYAGAISAVYSSNICEHFTGVMNTSVAGQIGVTEVQFVQIFAHLIAAVGGFEWTHHKIAGIEIALVLGIFVALGEFASGATMLVSTFEQCKQKTNQIWSSLVPIAYIMFMRRLSL